MHGDQHPDWEAGWHTVNVLLWSLNPKQGQDETEQFLRLLPTLLSRLQDGCDAMQLEPGERDEFFAQVAMLHAAVARAGLQASRDADGPVTRLGRDADLEVTEEKLAGLDPENLSIGSIKVDLGQDAEGIGRLKLGDALLFRSNGKDKRLYLQWISPMGGMFLFADADGYDAVSLTRARLLDKFERGELIR